ncbi:MAG: DNA mismatch repair protein MutS [Ruminococcaceae bacterium]|nr:DNA mismatch repair protein MutS [Oscillospiraceae bacterium]
MGVTPMMQQYLDIKEKNKDCIIFFRLGDFYEMFFEDAELVSRELELTLTGRDCGEGKRAPMCGVPYHAAETYLGRLVSKGYKVAICEQTEDPSQAKDIVRREIVRIVTPGTIIESELLTENKNNYLCSVYLDGNTAGLTFADVSTGDISSTEITGEQYMERLLNEIATYSPREVMLNVKKEICPILYNYAIQRLNAFVNENQADRYDITYAKGVLIRQFGKLPLDNGESVCDSIIASAGALLDYISETQKSDISYINELKIYHSGQYLEIDLNTRRNLELTETMRSKEKRGSLLWVLDKTKSSPGARLLRKWVETPLVNTHFITRRQKAVAELYGDYFKREELAECMKNVLDLERLMTKVIYGSAGGKDLKSISSTLAVIPQVKQLLADFTSDELCGIHDDIDELYDIYTLIEEAIVDDPPFSIREGGIIRKGYNEEVDRLNDIIANGVQYVKDLEEREKEKTGIKKLRVGYNRVFGYYIEILRSNTEEIPLHYIRKQTLSNCERYITQELKELESTILGATDRITGIEYEIFQRIREKIASQAERVQKTAYKLALIDVYVSLADVAVKNNYVCPEVDYSDVIDIKDGRHPVVEMFVRDSYFVPNDTVLDTGRNRLMLITGPNMAGKSTYMRQVALITLMAQIGSFVPAKEARIGIVDKIFTRIGASDDLASGQSTFMLEMNEVAYILKNATKKSLIIYDEIGRGTSTFDGMSIAKAVAEYSSSKKIGAKTLFATHYHELTTLEGQFDGIVNYNIAAKKKGDELIFLRKIVKGATDDSYGIEVALLAGVPTPVIKRAKEILKDIESGERTVVKVVNNNDYDELSFDSISNNEVIDKIKGIDLNTTTPIEALGVLFDLKKMLQ